MQTVEMAKLEKEHLRLSQEHISIFRAIDEIVIEANAESREMTEAEVTAIKQILSDIHLRKAECLSKMLALAESRMKKE